MSKNKPVSGTKEWAVHNVNCMRGCGHSCLYCYAQAQAKRFNFDWADTWETEQPNMVAVDKKYHKKQGTIMFPTAHDLTPGNFAHTSHVLLKLLESGNQVLVVSKPHLGVIKEICKLCEPYKKQILFRFTIGSMSDETLKFWEPGAPGFEERLEALRYAYENAFETSVSMEPLLETDEDQVEELCKAVYPYISDYIWIGKMNKVTERLKRNGHWDDPTVVEMAELLMASQTDERILSLYERLHGQPTIKWKESIKTVVGLEVPTEAGLDI